MQFIVVGLGNKGEDYKNTRHNVGWITLDRFWKDFNFGPWQESSKNKGEISEGLLGSNKVTLLKPWTMMNNSGKAVETLVKNKKSAGMLVVLHDDLDMGLGQFRILYNRGSGGHRGVESVVKALGTNEFVRIKVGVSPMSPSGKVRKPKGDKILDFIVGDFKKQELEKIKKVSKDVSCSIESIIMNGKDIAMTDWNGK